MMLKCILSKRGFTLVEILLVISLIAGLSLAVFSCLSNGLRLWDRSRVLMVEEDMAFFFDRFSSDLRNSFPFSVLSFEGSETGVAFPTVVMSAADKFGSRAAEGVVGGLGLAQYVFDSTGGVLVRRQANYSQALRNIWGEPRVMARGLKRVRFQFLPQGAKDYKFTQDVGDAFPAGVEVEVSFMSGAEEKTLRRFVSIPAGL